MIGARPRTADMREDADRRLDVCALLLRIRRSGKHNNGVFGLADQMYHQTIDRFSAILAAWFDDGGAVS